MALTNLPDPRLHDWVTWADSVILSNPRAARVLQVGVGTDDDATGWRVVADTLTLLEPNTPRHDSYSDWREWAISLMSVNLR